MGEVPLYTHGLAERGRHFLGKERESNFIQGALHVGIWESVLWTPHNIASLGALKAQIPTLYNSARAGGAHAATGEQYSHQIDASPYSAWS